jgi:flagellar biosynthesis chaperone FliJ
MKRFTTRYDKIRHLRAQQEDVCRAAAAARNAERAAAEQHRDAVRKWIESIERSAAAELSAGLSGAVLLSMTCQISQGHAELNAANDSVRQAEEKLREAIEEHRHARTELKVIEEIIHQEHTTFRRDQLRLQEHQLQEQASQAHYRRQELSREQDS